MDDKNYKNVNIKNVDVSELEYDDLEMLLYHFSDSMYLEEFDKHGMMPVIGENSKGIDYDKSLFFSIGIENVLKLSDVWLKWKMNRLFNPYWKDKTNKELEGTKFYDEFLKLSFTDYNEWEDYFLNSELGLKTPENDERVRFLFDYYADILSNSNYFSLDLEEGLHYNFIQTDIKKASLLDEIENVKGTIANEEKRGVYSNDLKRKLKRLEKNKKYLDVMYGDDDLNDCKCAPAWNLQTTPGFNFILNQDKIKKLVVGEDEDALSVVLYFYNCYLENVDLFNRTRFDLLDSFMKYVDEKYYEHIMDEKNKTL